MKTGKAILIGAALLFTTAAVHAQSMKNMIKIGALAGASVLLIMQQQLRVWMWLIKTW